MGSDSHRRTATDEKVKLVFTVYTIDCCMKDETLCHMIRPTRSQLKAWEKLHQAKHRRQDGLFLVEGLKVVRELLKSNWSCRAVLVMENKTALLDDFLHTVPREIDVYLLTEMDWRKLSQDKGPEGIMAVVSVPRSNETDPLSVLDGTGHLLLLYRISNPNNLGAIIRTAHWLGIRKILLSSGSVDYTNSKVVRSAMGSLFHTVLLAGVDFLQIIPEIKKRYVVVTGSNKKGETPHPCTEKTAMILGSESHGLPDALLRMANEQWHIPGEKDADSLSLPQAAAIMMYACAKQTS
jgi:RNA methyltransferase, TrmH family